MSAWPRSSWTYLGLTPCLRRNLVHVWRRSWKRTAGRLARSRRALKERLRLPQRGRTDAGREDEAMVSPECAELTPLALLDTSRAHRGTERRGDPPAVHARPRSDGRRRISCGLGGAARADRRGEVSPIERGYTTSSDLSTPVRRGMTAQVTSRPAAAQHLRDLARLRRVRDRIDREYAQPLDVEALARGAHMSAGHLSRQFRRAYGESPYSYLMTRRIERAMALLRRGDLSVTEVCFTVGCSSLGTFSTRFTELVGVPPSVYRRQAARATAGMPSCVVKQVTRPIRNREV